MRTTGIVVVLLLFTTSVAAAQDNGAPDEVAILPFVPSAVADLRAEDEQLEEQLADADIRIPVLGFSRTQLRSVLGDGAALTVRWIPMPDPYSYQLNYRGGGLGIYVYGSRLIKQTQQVVSDDSIQGGDLIVPATDEEAGHEAFVSLNRAGVPYVVYVACGDDTSRCSSAEFLQALVANMRFIIAPETD